MVIGGVIASWGKRGELECLGYDIELRLHNTVQQ